jgi:mycothiol system anti-sigma-R factor
MKNFNDYCTNIYLYLDEEADDAGSEEFWAHCNECRLCREAVHAEKELSRLLKSVSLVSPAPEGLRERVLDLVSEQKSSFGSSPISRLLAGRSFLFDFFNR